MNNFQNLSYIEILKFYDSYKNKLETYEDEIALTECVRDFLKFYLSVKHTKKERNHMIKQLDILFIEYLSVYLLVKGEDDPNMQVFGSTLNLLFKD